MPTTTPSIGDYKISVLAADGIFLSTDSFRVQRPGWVGVAPDIPAAEEMIRHDLRRRSLAAGGTAQIDVPINFVCDMIGS